MSDLKPCPFCGGEAEVYGVRRCGEMTDHLEDRTIRCKKCHIPSIEYGAHYGTEDVFYNPHEPEMIKRWNTREPQDQWVYDILNKKVEQIQRRKKDYELSDNNLGSSIEGAKLDLVRNIQMLVSKESDNANN